MVGKSFVPTSKYNAEKANTKTKEEALNALKTEYETFKQSKMTDDEKRAEKERIKEENYQRQNLMISKMYAENIFAKAGFQEEDYKGILDGIVQEDAEKTKVLAETICNTMVKQKQEAEKSLKDKLIKGTKTPPAGNDNDDGEQGEIEKYKKLYEEAVKNNDFLKMSYYTRLMQEAQKNKE